MKQDKAHSEKIDAFTDALVGELTQATQAIEKEFLAAGGSSHLKNLKYVEREEDEELKEMFAAERKRLDELQERMGDKIDGEIDMDLHGNITIKNHEKTEGL